MNEEKIDLSYVLALIKKRSLLIISISFGAAILAAIISFYVLVPKYEANAKFFIGKEEGSVEGYDNNEVIMYQNLMATYAETIKTADLLKRAVDNCGYDYNISLIKQNLSVITASGTQIIETSFRNEDPTVAYEILNEISKEFISLAQELVPNGNVKIIQEPKTPSAPISPNKMMNIAVAFFLGFLVSLGIIFMLEYLDNTYKNKNSLQEELDIPVVGVIPFMDFLGKVE